MTAIMKSETVVAALLEPRHVGSLFSVENTTGKFVGVIGAYGVAQNGAVIFPVGLEGQATESIALDQPVIIYRHVQEQNN